MFRICRVLPLVTLLTLPALAGDDTCLAADCQRLTVGSACEASCLAATAQALLSEGRASDLRAAVDAQLLADLASGARGPDDLKPAAREGLVAFAAAHAISERLARQQPTTPVEVDRLETALPDLVRTDTPTWFDLSALVALGRGQEQRALTLVERSLKARPDDVTALVLRGSLRARQADLDRAQTRLALRDLQRAVRLDPEHVAALTCLGEALMAHGQSGYAGDPLDRAIELDPEYARARTLRTLLALHREDWDDAEADARAAVELAEGRDWHQAMRLLCVVQLARGSWEAANRMSNDLTRIDGNDPWAWFARSVSADELGLPADARMARVRWQATAADADRAFLAEHLPERLAEQAAAAGEG